MSNQVFGIKEITQAEADRLNKALKNCLVVVIPFCSDPAEPPVRIEEFRYIPGYLSLRIKIRRKGVPRGQRLISYCVQGTKFEIQEES